jgi:hypothetical protein
MNRRIDAHLARTQLGQIMDLGSTRRTHRRHYERAGFYPHRRPSPGLAAKGLGGCQAARPRHPDPG